MYATPGVHTRPTVRLLTPQDTDVEPPADGMEVSDSEPPLFEVTLASVLSRKTRLRQKLLRTDHHRVFLHSVTETTSPQGALGSVAKYTRFKNFSIKSLNKINK